jgi:hypothetical protein
VEVQAFLIKFALTFLNYALGDELQKLRLVLTLILATMLFWLYLRWAPHLIDWVNHLRCGLYASILLVASLAVALVYGPKDPAAQVAHHQRVTLLLWALLGPSMLLGAAASYLRVNVWRRWVLGRFARAAPGTKTKHIYKFGDPREVEVVSRCCRKWTDAHREVLDRGAVRDGELILRAGLQLFPGRCEMLILWSNYLISVLDNSPSGYSQMAAARQAKPGWQQRFAIFAREQVGGAALPGCCAAHPRSHTKQLPTRWLGLCAAATWPTGWACAPLPPGPQEQLQRMSSARGGESGVDLVSGRWGLKGWGDCTAHARHPAWRLPWVSHRVAYRRRSPMLSIRQVRCIGAHQKEVKCNG